VDILVGHEIADRPADELGRLGAAQHGDPAAGGELYSPFGVGHEDGIRGSVQERAMGQWVAHGHPVDRSAKER